MAASLSTELITTLKENTQAMGELRTDVQNLRHDLNIHNTAQKTFEELVRKHEVQLNGDEKSTGLVHSVGSLTKSMSNIERAVWVVVGVILTALAAAWIGML